MQHRYRALTIRWFDWNYNILLLELINSNNNCIEFSCHSFFLFFFWNQKRVFRDYQSLGFKADGLSISIWRHFPRESRVFHDFRSLQRWSTWTLNLVTWRIIGWNQAVLEQRAGVSRKTKAVTRFRVLYSRRCSCNDTGDNRYIAVASSKSVCTVSCYQILKRRSNLVQILCLSDYSPISNIYRLKYR